MTSEELVISVDDAPDGAAMVHVAGEVDMATAPQLGAALATLEGRPVTVELSGVTFMDSTGLSVLVTALRRARDGNVDFNVTGERGVVARTIRLTGLDDVFRHGQSAD